MRHYASMTILLLTLATQLFAAGSEYPDLRDSHDAELQAQLDAALDERRYRRFWKGVRNKQLSVVVADITDLHHPKVAWYNPDLMLYAASVPKVAIALGALVEIERGKLKLDDQLRGQLIRMIKNSSNRDATAVLNKVGMERLQEILADERYGKLYDPDYGGGLWVGKAYAKSGPVRRDPLKNLSHGASAMQAARLYYGIVTGTILDRRQLPLLREMFGEPAIKHKFVKGLEGREGLAIYRKSGTWRNFHADSGVFVRDNVTYIAVAIDQNPAAAQGLVNGIRIVDDLMLERARQREKQ